jgi:two-component system sensor histidine kinase BaeS
MMFNDPRLKNILLFIGGALIALSLALFLSAIVIRDFGQPGRETLITGQSTILLVISFSLLCGLAIALLIVLSRTLNSPVSSPAAVPARSRQKGPKTEAPDAAESIAAASTLGQQVKSAQILSDAAGELRTSVGAIEEELEDMIDDDDPIDQEHMQSLFEETDRLKKIIDGMEQLSQAQALARSLRREPLELEPMLRTALEKTRKTAQGRDVTFTLTCEPGLTMIADPECLRIIMENIMDNAAKAVKNAGSVTLNAARKGDQIVFSISDTGTGIRPKHLTHIYERFFRGTGTGIGMGLTIVKELVDACGGKIQVQTEPGKGSVFTIHISAS